MTFRTQCEKSTSPATEPPSPCLPPGSENTISANTPTSSSVNSPTAASPLPSSNRHNPPTLQRDVALTEIQADQNAPNRLDEDPERIKKLAASIAADGLINPITLRNHNGKLEILAGRRRLAAFRLLGRESIPATIRETQDHQAATIKLAENVARSNLSPVEEATQLALAVKDHPAGVDGVAAAIGRSVNWILDRLDMCEWPESLLAHVHTAKISMAAAKRLARVQDPTQREYYIDQAARCGINARTAALWLQDANRIPSQEQGLSENIAGTTAATYRTTTEVQCFVCNEWRDLSKTTPARICHQCVQELGHAPTLVSRQTKEPQPTPNQQALK